VNIKPTQVVIGVAAGALLAGGGYAAAASTSNTVHTCINPKTHALYVEAKCPKTYSSLEFNRQGLRGATGATGPQGPAGDTGATGATGAKGSTGATGLTGATGATGAQGIQGETGDTGAAGTNGTNGSAATVAVGTVSTGAAGSNATVTNSGTSSAATLNFSIPQGAAGTNGTANAWGEIDGSSGATVESGSDNVLSALAGSGGRYSVLVQGCTAASPTEAAISAQVNVDPADSSNPLNSSYSPDQEASAFVDGYAADGSHKLEVNLNLVNVFTDTPATGDFSISVNC
jgi:hypothetical protein